MFKQFGSALGQARQIRQQEEATIQVAENELEGLAGLKDAQGNRLISDQEAMGLMEMFGSEKHKDRMGAVQAVQGLKGKVAMHHGQEKADLERRDIESQIAFRGAQAKAAGATEDGGLTSQQKDFLFAKDRGFGGSFEDFLTLKQPKHILTPQQQAEATALGSRLSGMEDFAKDIKSQGFAATPKIQNLDRAIEMLTPDAEGNVRFETGALVQGKAKAAKFVDALGLGGFAETLGIDMDKELTQAEFAEEFRNKTLPAALEMVSLTSGAISDREFKEFIDSSANLGNTTEGNLAILRFSRAALDNQRKLAKLISKMQGDGASTTDIDRAIHEFKNDPKNSIIHELRGGASTAEQPPAQEAEGQPATVEPTQFTEQNPARPTTMGEKEALEDGTPYLNPFDGQIYIKGQ
jgi:hypothetical protein